MFMHRTCGRHAPAVSLGILTAIALTLTAQAAPTPDPFVLVAYSNRTGGAPLANGDYDGAAQAVQQSANSALADPQALETNRCVAYAMTRQLQQARAACDAAVRAARVDDSSWVQWNPKTRQQTQAYAAAAYSNRAVLHWLDAQPAAARQDLARAQALAPDASFVARNLSALQAHQNLTSQVTAIPAAAAVAPK
jgi:tetratricopeptide (TPR) repeat protein